MDCSECGGTWWRPMPCTRADCPLCADAVARRRSRRLYERLGGLELGVLVVTFPAEWRRFIVGEAALQVEAALRQAVCEWGARVLGGAIGGRVFWHPCGDECRACGEGSDKLAKLGKCDCGAVAEYKPHLNFIIPGAVLCPDGSVQRRHMFLGARQLHELRVALSNVLGEVATIIGPVCTQAGKKVLLPAAEDGDPAINFHWSYRSEKEKKLHALRYFPRPFPAWRDSMPHMGKDFGMLAGQDERRKEFRAAVRGELEPEESPCPCCGATVILRRGVDVHRLTRPSWEAATGHQARDRERAGETEPSVPAGASSTGTARSGASA